MSEKKNIDRLFQEKFKDFEVAPPENAWENIEAELRKEKKKRVIPIWFRLSGVAAILIIGLLLTMPIINGIDDSQPVIKENPDGSNTASPKGIPLKTSEGVTQSNETENRTKSNESSPSSSVTSVTNEGTSVNGSVNSGGSNKAVVYQKGDRNNKAGGRDKRDNNKSGLVRADSANEAFVSNESGTAGKNNTVNTDTNVKSGNNANPDNGNITIAPKANEAVVENNIKTDNNTTDSNNPDNPALKEDKEKLLEEMIDKNTNNQAVAATEMPADSVPVIEENALEKLLQEKENEKENTSLAEAVKNTKWNIRPQVAPVFYNSFSEGSPIDSQFAANSKSYDSDLSYGVGVDYALSDKFSIRSGINNVNLSYATNDIEFQASLNGQTNNVAAKGRSANIVVQNQGTAASETTGLANFAASDLSNQTFNGSMIQEMGYIEVPLEMSYKLVDKRFGIEVIGGMSTLFLNNNNVSVLSDQGYRSDVGEAQNLNNVSFSTNVGVGFKYRFWKSFEANFEPTLKYQVNTFSENAGNFKPYFIGLYSGISFRF